MMDLESKREICNKVFKDLSNKLSESVSLLEETLGSENVSPNAILSGVIYFVCQTLSAGAEDREELNGIIKRFQDAVHEHCNSFWTEYEKHIEAPELPPGLSPEAKRILLELKAKLMGG